MASMAKTLAQAVGVVSQAIAIGQAIQAALV